MKTDIEKKFYYVNEPQKVQKLALIYSHSHPTVSLKYYVENGLKLSFFERLQNLYFLLPTRL